MNQKTRMDWMAEQRRQELAGELADDIVERLRMTAPIDPLAIARTEAPFLRSGGRDLGNRYDGKLEYNRARNIFLLFFNTKYDVGLPPGAHHPRTRFSVGHELGHYFLERHRAYLMRGGKPHPSVGEFRVDLQIEREADSFAASLLLPTRLARPLVNARELSMARVQEIAGHFNASLISTVIRCVRLSDFPCAVAGIREGAVAWLFPSESLISAGIYPKKGTMPPNARERYSDFQAGISESATNDGKVRDWFETYDRDDLDAVDLTEEYLPARVLDTLLVLLTLDERDVFEQDDDDDDDDDDD